MDANERVPVGKKREIYVARAITIRTNKLVGGDERENADGRRGAGRRASEEKIVVRRTINGRLIGGVLLDSRNRIRVLYATSELRNPDSAHRGMRPAAIAVTTGMYTG